MLYHIAARRALAAPCLAILCLAAVSLPAMAASEQYSVIFGGRPVGTLDADSNGAATRITYDYKNNGRGPTMAEALTVDSAGLPTSWKVTGTTTFGSKVSESFARTGNRAEWTDATGSGNALIGTPALYISQFGSPWSAGLYARALLQSGNRMAALPGGTVKLEKIAEVQAGDTPVTAYALFGIDSDPTTLFLDRQQQLFAVASPGFAVVRKGAEGSEQQLRDLVAKWDTERMAQYQQSLAHRPATALRITNVRLFQPETGTLSAPSSVVVKADRITAVEPASAPSRPGETLIDGNGGTLLAGFSDMHGHLGQDSALSNLAAGITTVRDMGNTDAVLDKLVERIESGELAGPSVVRSGFIEGKSATNAEGGTTVTTEAEAVAAVQKYADKGFFEIKIYSSINPAWVPAMAKAAHARGLKVVGHIPAFTTTDAMLGAGYDEITHINQMMLNWVLQPGDDTRTLLRITALKRLAGFDLDSPAPRKTLALVKEKGAAHDPTLVIIEHLALGRTGESSPATAGWIDHMPVNTRRDLKQAMLDVSTPEDDKAYRGSFETAKEVVRRLNQQGTLILPGTDMGGDFWYHRELELYTQVGMTNAQVLKRATADTQDYMGRGKDYGRIAPGMKADFMLLPGDPLADIKAINAIAMVVKNGTVYFPTEIYEKMGIQPFTTAPVVSGAPFAH